MQTLVFFDIGSSRLRLQVERVCRDYGLLREQYSVFLGDISVTQRERLTLKLRALVRKWCAHEPVEERDRQLVVQVLPVCSADFDKMERIRRGRDETGPCEDEKNDRPRPSETPAVLVL